MMVMVMVNVGLRTSCRFALSFYALLNANISVGVGRSVGPNLRNASLLP